MRPRRPELRLRNGADDVSERLETLKRELEQFGADNDSAIDERGVGC